jgi:hypothetical protein
MITRSAAVDATASNGFSQGCQAARSFDAKPAPLVFAFLGAVVVGLASSVAGTRAVGESLSLAFAVAYLIAAGTFGSARNRLICDPATVSCASGRGPEPAKKPPLANSDGSYSTFVDHQKVMTTMRGNS